MHRSTRRTAVRATWTACEWRRSSRARWARCTSWPARPTTAQSSETSTVYRSLYRYAESQSLTAVSWLPNLVVARLFSRYVSWVWCEVGSSSLVEGSHHLTGLGFPIPTTIPHIWCIRALCAPVCRKVYIKDPLLLTEGARCSSVVTAFAHVAMGRHGRPIELFLVPASAPVVCAILSVGWCI